ncbi:putative Se/S carrier-like protein, partial [Escherichia coli]|uniref:putative Se/S carrier-like protein n=1 Tax=Escherichia coli TaxID=562 RepID=UPI001C6270BB
MSWCKWRGGHRSAAEKTRKKEYLFLFHSTVGVIQTSKALQAAVMTFRVSDIPRDLRGCCG